MRFVAVPERSRVFIDARSTLHPIHMEATGLIGELDAVVEGEEITLTDPPVFRLELPVARLTSRSGLTDAQLRQRIEAERYPVAVAVGTGARRIGPGRFHVTGNLTFHGVTRAVDGDITVTRNGPESVVAEGEQVFDMRQYGVEPPSLLMMKVRPEVRVRIRVEGVATSE